MAVRRAVRPRAQKIVDAFQRNVSCFRHRKKQPNHHVSGNRERCDEHDEHDEHDEQRQQPCARGAARHDESDAEQRSGGARAMCLIVRSRPQWRYFAQRTRDADDDCPVEAEQYSGEARDDDDSDVRHAVRGLPLDARVRALGRLSEMLKTSDCKVSALSFPCVTTFGFAAGLSRHRRCRYNGFFGLRTGDSIERAPLRYRFTQ
jgi:hypothetical protein